MIVSFFISPFVVLHLCIVKKKEIYSSNLLLHITCSKKSYGNLLYRISSHMSCRKLAECCHKDLAKCQKSKMPTFMTQDERVVSAGLLATPCILGHCCSESGQNKNRTSNFLTKKGKAILSPFLM